MFLARVLASCPLQFKLLCLNCQGSRNHINPAYNRKAAKALWMLGRNLASKRVALKMSFVSWAEAKCISNGNFISYLVTFMSPCFKPKNLVLFLLRVTSQKYCPRNSLLKLAHIMVSKGLAIILTSHQWIVSQVNWNRFVLIQIVSSFKLINVNVRLILWI